MIKMMPIKLVTIKNKHPKKEPKPSVQRIFYNFSLKEEDESIALIKLL